MLNYKYTNILFVALFVSLLISGFLLGTSFYLLGLIVLIYLAIVAYGCINIQSNFFLSSYSKTNTNEKIIALSFDDGPNNTTTPKVLEILNRENIKACFFCIGREIHKNPEILISIHKEGHIIGNHSYSHDFWFDMKSPKEMYDDLKKTQKIIHHSINESTIFFRPPYGVINPNLKKAIEKCGYHSIGWSLRSFDTKIKTTDKLLNKIYKGLKPGTIFLFHDTMEITVNVLPEFIKKAKQEGFTFVRLDHLLQLKPYA